MDKENKSVKSEIGKNLKKIRSEKKITQRKLSEAMNCSEVFISNIEREHTYPSMKTIVNMANSLNVPLSIMLYGNKANEMFTISGEYNGLFNDLSTIRTVYILKMMYEVKKQLEEYGSKAGDAEDLVAEDIDYKALGNSIGQLREEKHISRGVMARRLGIKEGVYRNIENNNGKASVCRYMEIAKELNVPIDCLFEDSLVNKEVISRSYIHKIFQDLNGREKQIIKEISQIVHKILRAHDL